MKLQSSNKARIIILISIFTGILILFVIIFRSAKDTKKANQINPRVHADMSSDLTYEEMMKYQNTKNYNTRKTQYEIEDEAERRRKDSLLNATQNRLEKIEQIDANPKPKPKPKPKKPDTVVIVMPPVKPEPPKSKFFTPTEKKERTNTIQLVIHGEQTVYNGSNIKMRLIEPLKIGKYTIPTGSYVYGVVSIGNERLNIRVSNVQYNDIILPVDKTIYDKDGMAGLYVPMNLPAQGAKEGTREGVNEGSRELRSSSGNLVSRASNAIVSAGRRVVTRGNQIEKVTVKSNYKLYLKDSSEDDIILRESEALQKKQRDEQEQQIEELKDEKQ